MTENTLVTKTNGTEDRKLSIDKICNQNDEEKKDNVIQNDNFKEDNQIITTITSQRNGVLTVSTMTTGGVEQTTKNISSKLLNQNQFHSQQQQQQQSNQIQISQLPSLASPSSSSSSSHSVLTALRRSSNENSYKIEVHKSESIDLAENDGITSTNTDNIHRDSIHCLSPSSISSIGSSFQSGDRSSSPIKFALASSEITNTITNVKQSDVDEIAKLFEEKPEAFEKWLQERAPPEAITKLHDFIEGRRLSLKRPSVTSDLFQQWLASSPVKSCRSPKLRNTINCRKHLQDLDEGELFMELIRDVANELDIDVLCHKILVNVGLLTHADRGSLFLAKGTPNNRYLIAKLFDVTQTTELNEAVEKVKNEEIIIPFGVGIAGTVAQTKEIINIKEAYKDSRFNAEIDLKTGYKTNAILSMPICNYEGDVIGVAQIINKTNDTTEFTDHDVEIFRRYLTFCGIGIQNAQLFEMSVQEYRRNQILLNLARSIFEEQNNLECLVTKIMTEARELLKCERCAVYLLDLECCEASHLEKILEKPKKSGTISRISNDNVKVEDILRHQKSRTRFSVLFELGSENQSANVSRPSINDLSNSTLAQIAQYVATTGQTLNIADVKDWLGEQYDNDDKQQYCNRNNYGIKSNRGIRDDDDDDDENNDEIHLTKAILCMPIVNAQKTVVGVAQLINKGNGLPFTDSDASIFEAFAIFCGLGIHNTQMYENACKLMAKQKVALECLSYHATASRDQTVKLVQDTIESAETYNLYSFKFIDFDLSDDDTCRATVRMFLQCNLVQQFHIPYDVLCRWVLSVRKNYRPVKYHNWRHALNVAQTMFAMLKTGKMERFMTDLEILGLLVACLCHDLDHRGTNNAFQTKTESPLAILYSTSTMEHHHFDQCVMILNSEGNNIFQALSPEDYRKVMKTVETAILSTDLAMYFKKRNSFLELVENGEFDWQSEEKKELLCGMMMTACDVSAIAKPWEVQHRVAKLVADEFFDQGDLEKLQLNTQPVAMMDRERKDELPKMQVGFIDVICLPLYRVLSDTFPWIQPLYDGTLENRNHWQDLAEKVEMGLTWIDHDVIEKPVEEFLGHTEDIKDIEFTVTTLNCQHNESNETTTPVHRPRFSSLKKSGALSKIVRSRLSKSLYNSVENKSKQSRFQQKGVTKKATSITTPTTVTESIGISKKYQSSSSSENILSSEKYQDESSKIDKSTSGKKSEKSKKRNKLCSLL